MVATHRLSAGGHPREFRISLGAAARLAGLGMAALLAVATPAWGRCRPASLTILTPPPPYDAASGINLDIHDVSADGSTAVGNVWLTNWSQAVRAVRQPSGGWTLSLLPLPAGEPSWQSSFAQSVSADGTVIVGGRHRWTVGADGSITPHRLPGGFDWQNAWVSDNGLVITGADFSNRAIRMVGGIASFFDGPSPPRGVSADGSVIVGGRWRWEAGTLQDLATNPFFTRQRANALAVSGDGRVVVGGLDLSSSGGPNLAAAAMWVDQSLPVIISKPFTSQSLWNSAYGVATNHDGSVIIGNRNDQVFVWTQALGQADLTTLMATFGIARRGEVLAAPTGISADGLTIGGFTSTDIPSPGSRGFIVTLPLLLTRAPVSVARACVFGPTTFTVAAVVSGTPTVQWEIADPAAPSGYRALTDGPLLIGGSVAADVSGSGGWTLTVTPRSAGGPQAAPLSLDGAAFRARVSTPCGSMVSTHASMTLCRPDFNCSGVANIDDIFIYLNAWFAADPRADMSSPPNGVSIDDIFIFLNLWFAGC